MKKKSINWNLIIAIFFTFVLIGFWIVAWFEKSHYVYDFFLLQGLLWGMFFLKKRLNLFPFHFFLFGIFLVFHHMGVFGAYGWYFFGIEYDFWVHTYFGIITSLILYRAPTLIGGYDGWFKCAIIVFVVLGFSALHELFEFAGALILGKGEGVLFMGAGDLDPWDTQKDMWHNLLGSIIGLLIYKAKIYFSR